MIDTRVSKWSRKHAKVNWSQCRKSADGGCAIRPYSPEASGNADAWFQHSKRHSIPQAERPGRRLWPGHVVADVDGYGPAGYSHLGSGAGDESSAGTTPTSHR